MKTRILQRWSLALAAGLALPAWAAGPPPRALVTVSPQADRNVADTPWFPAPLVYISNPGKEPIELSVFLGQPDFVLEREQPGPQAGSISIACGNGYVPYRIEPGQGVSFSLWRDPRFTWVAGRYRVRLQYTALRSAGRASAEALSEPFELQLGATRPAGWREGAAPGDLVVLSSTFRSFLNPQAGQPPPADTATLRNAVLPAVKRCITDAQKRLPWLRGQFGISFFTVKKDQSWQRHVRTWGSAASDSYNETELQHSTLGDALVHACFADVRLAAPMTSSTP
jgi:hypothetical protein